MNVNSKCISDVLQAICLLQNDKCGENNLEINKCNTRPIIIYNCQGIPWTIPIDINNTNNNQQSYVFRIEKINDCCVTLRGLDKIENSKDQSTVFIATKAFIIVDAKCICAIRCLDDTYVDFF